MKKAFGVEEILTCITGQYFKGSSIEGLAKHVSGKHKLSNNEAVNTLRDYRSFVAAQVPCLCNIRPSMVKHLDEIQRLELVISLKDKFGESFLIDNEALSSNLPTACSVESGETALERVVSRIKYTSIPSFKRRVITSLSGVDRSSNKLHVTTYSEPNKTITYQFSGERKNGHYLEETSKGKVLEINFKSYKNDQEVGFQFHALSKDGGETYEAEAKISSWSGVEETLLVYGSEAKVCVRALTELMTLIREDREYSFQYDISKYLKNYIMF